MTLNRHPLGQSAKDGVMDTDGINDDMRSRQLQESSSVIELTARLLVSGAAHHFL
jgi:hypothetical protein